MARWLDIFLWSTVFAFARSVLVNRTIDDTLGDPITQFIPIYQPATLGVWEDASCVSCAIKPSKDLAFDGTWTAATYKPLNFSSMSIELQFTGVAIYVFFILANNQGFDIVTRTFCLFLLDGTADTTFIHRPTTSEELQYDVLAYQKTGLPNTTHNVTILADTTDLSLAPTEQVYLNFDYAIYTFDDDTAAPPAPSSSHAGTSAIPTSSSAKSGKGTPVAAIAGAISGVLLVTLAAGLSLFYFRRRRRKATEGDSNHLDHAYCVAPFDPGANPLSSDTNGAELGSAANSREVRQQELGRKMAAVQRNLSGRVAEVQQGNSNGLEMAELRTEVDQLRDQLVSLQNQRQSPWALGLSDEPPPGYTPG